MFKCNLLKFVTIAVLSVAIVFIVLNFNNISDGITKLFQL